MAHKIAGALHLASIINSTLECKTKLSLNWLNFLVLEHAYASVQSRIVFINVNGTLVGKELTQGRS